MSERVYEFTERHHRRIAQVAEFAAVTWVAFHRDWVGVLLVAFLSLAAWIDGYQKRDER